MMILSRDLNIGLLNFSSRIPLNLPPILAQSQSPSKAPSRIISWCRGRFWGGRKKMCVDPGEPWAMRIAPWGSRLAMVSGRLRVPESLYSILIRVKGPLTPPDCPRAPTREAPTTNTPGSSLLNKRDQQPPQEPGSDRGQKCLNLTPTHHESSDPLLS